MRVGGSDGWIDEWMDVKMKGRRQGGKVTQIFLITRRKVIWTSLGNKDIENNCGHRINQLSVIFNWKFPLVTWAPKGEGGRSHMF